MIKNPEKETEVRDRSEKKTDNGYSESEQARDIESRSGDLHALKRSTSVGSVIPVSQVQLPLVEEYNTISVALGNLIRSYTKLLAHDLHLAKKLLDDIHKHQKQQQELFEKIIGKR